MQWIIKNLKKCDKNVVGLVLLLTVLSCLRVDGRAVDIRPNLVGILLSAPWRALSMWKPVWAICLYVVSLCWLYYRLRHVMYAYLSWAIGMVLCYALAGGVQFYPSIAAFDHLFEWMTVAYQCKLLFVMTCTVILVGKSCVRLFVPFSLKTLVCCCVTALIPWLTVLMWLHFSMTAEFAVFFLNIDIFPFFFCMMFLSSLLDVWILDVKYAEMDKLNMTAAIGMNTMVYCFMVMLLYKERNLI
jgi:hypothetical protein